MNVLVLGASSAIGSRVAAAFASDNDLFLTGRDAARLAEASKLCLARGATNVTPFECDLKNGAEPILRAVNGTPIGLLIHAASALSRLRDEEILADQLPEQIHAEVVAPLEVVRTLLDARRGQPMSVLYISSILAVLPTPRRLIYGRLKGVLEQALLSLQEQRPNLDVRILRVSKVIDKERDSPDLDRLAEVAARAMRGRERIVSYGTSGRVLLALYNTQPLVVRGLMHVRRLLQRSEGD
jgi:short-subunit dehydrogenase